MSLDISSNATGLAILRKPMSGPPKLMHEALFKARPTGTVHERIDWMVDAITANLEPIADHEPASIVVIEWAEGSPWMSKKYGAGWSRSVIPLAAAQGAIRQTVRSLFPAASIEHYTSTQWSGRVPKTERAVKIATMYQDYRERYYQADTGFDLADAIGLGLWRLGY